MNLKNVLHILGLFLFFLGLTMVPAMVISFYTEGGDLQSLAASFFITSGAGFLLALLFEKSEERISLTRREGFLIATLGWVFAAAFGGLPFLIHGAAPTFTDSFFETMSGFTTTGASVISGLDHLPRGLLFWRAFTQWLGGMGIIVLAIAVLPVLGVGGMQLYKAELPSPVKDKITPRVVDTAKLLWGVYVLISLVQFFLLMFGGMSAFDAACHTFATMATGGFGNYDASISHFQSIYIEGVIIFFMAVAGMNFALHYRLLTGDVKSFLKDSELHFYLIVILVATAIITVDIHLSLFYSLEKALRASLFQVVSIMTTTGFVTDNFDKWPLPSRIILLLLMFIGGCAGSTGGAIKCLRILLIIKHSYLEFYRLIHPHAVVVVKLGRHIVPADIMASIRSFFFLYISTAVAATLCLAFLGLDLISAFSAVATTLGNVGPGLGMVNPLSNFFEVPQAGKWILSFCMLLGRLEIFTVLVLLIPDFWKK
ncbi:MAG TPA: potassium transporter TrkG [Syntrophales bacterium]|nr:potassium transporter TrkG [Syntrophales bacterium]HOX94394.1 potassium transporter TrkG [Syntrophales bacterium]HPI58044.1 potassium transporter TrkG [Syntrophales bacterium]HPN25260.1 potassium transporter TrkG [Syntrophales bacterium]HQM29321.1 potassium transporter TrkG [Syntrophales bacterium]